MAKAKKTIPPHLHARQQLLSRITTSAVSGERRLPSERTLSEEFGVSLCTMQKVVRQLIREGRIFSVPRTGNFISAVPAAPNIGIIVGEGAVSTFLCSPIVLRGILEVLDTVNCFVRIIQLRKPEEALDMLRLHMIDGCVWYLPHPSLFPLISRIVKTSRIPIVVPVETFTPYEASQLPPHHFIPDFNMIGRIRAEHLLRRGHRRIAFCGATDTDAYKGFITALEEMGLTHNTDWNLTDIEDIPKRLAHILETGEITALISHGGFNRLETLFQTLNSRADCGKLELLVDSTGPSLSDLLASYPRVKVVAVSYSNGRQIGRAAAEVLVAAVTRGTSIQSARFASEIQSPKEMTRKEYQQ